MSFKENIGRFPLRFSHVLVALATLLPVQLMANDFTQADFVVVKKAERKLYLYKGDELIKSYPVWLGKNPQGHKQREGDNRTPEGRYVLDWRNPFSDYFLSMHVSYPSASDLARARTQGVSPGGSIMIHGLPNEPKKPLDYYKSTDWTFGCIAVLNQHMGEIWRMVADNTPIEILP